MNTGLEVHIYYEPERFVKLVSNEGYKTDYDIAVLCQENVIEVFPLRAGCGYDYRAFRSMIGQLVYGFVEHITNPEL